MPQETWLQMEAEAVHEGSCELRSSISFFILIQSFIPTYACYGLTSLAFHVKSLRRFKQGRYMVIFGLFNINFNSKTKSRSQRESRLKQGGH